LQKQVFHLSCVFFYIVESCSVQKPIIKITSAAVIALIVSQAQAGAFSLYTESSPAAIGNFAAGIAAEGADASIGWYNPAGLILIKERQVVFGGVGVFPSSTLTGTSTYTTPLPFPGLPPAQYVQSFSGLQGAQSAGVPSLHYALPLGERAVFGLSVVSPFGLATDYDFTSPVRYAATLSKLEIVDFSPELGGKITDHFSIGAGLDLQYARVKFNQMLGSPAYLEFIQALGEVVNPYSLDSQSYNSGDSFAVGFHAGVLFRFDDNHARLGVNYQSSVQHQFTGSSRLVGPLADSSLNIFFPAEADPNASYSSGNLYSNYIELPDVLTISGYKDVNDKLALLGSIVYFGWSSFNNITLNNVAAGIPLELGNTFLTTLDSTTLENYRDTWRFALGANYHVNPQWMLRVGGGYDQTPTVNAYRDVRLPDSNRFALSVGTHYQMKPNLGFDLGYTYLFAANDAVVNNTEIIRTSTYNVNATAKNYAQLLGVQAVWKLDGVTK
jgi:long-chain fatty acid transport protein